MTGLGLCRPFKKIGVILKIKPTPSAHVEPAAPDTDPAVSIHKAFRIEPVIDWVELEVTFQAAQEFKWVRKALRNLLKAESVPEASVYVQRQGAPLEGRRHHAFRFRLHDVAANSPSMLRRILEGLSAWREFAERPSITAIEISLDFWPKTNAPALTQTTKTLQGMTLGDGGVARQVIDDRSAFSMDEFGDILDGASVYIGNQESKLLKGTIATPYAWRTYFKVTDNNKKPLPSSMHRPRVEVTLQGEALHELYLTNPFELSSYPFRSLAKLFRFRRMLPLEQILKTFSEEAELCKTTKAMLKAELAAIKATHSPTPPEKLKQLRFRVGLIRTIRAAVIKLYEESAHALTWEATGWSQLSASKKESIRASKCRSTESYDELNDRVTKALRSLEQRMKAA